MRDDICVKNGFTYYIQITHVNNPYVSTPKFHASTDSSEIIVMTKDLGGLL